MASSETSDTSNPLVAAIDQGTSSTRVLIFASKTAELITYHQTELKQIFPKEGWCEQDPFEILKTVRECIEKAVANLKDLNYNPSDVKAIGITNQRETTIVWDKNTGKPLHNAIVWLDSRTAETVEAVLQEVPGNNQDHFKPICGLPIATTFSALKLRWLLDNCDEVKKALQEDRLLFGTVDTWLLWNFTGGVDGGKFLTDVTNASRTMFMNIHDLQWDQKMYNFFQIPKSILPEIHSSSEIYGYLSETSLKGTPISGILGDQQAALVGQHCFRQGQAKNTYGTGCFLLYNTGTTPVLSENGLLTTVGYQFGPDKPPVYALEGSIAIAGDAVRWLRDNMGFIEKASDIEALAGSVDTTHGCYFVPAFTGLCCPYWQSDARGVICGLTHFTNRGHIARASLEAVCFQTREVLDVMNRESGVGIKSIQADGGMTANSLLMQIQADLTGIPVVRPSMLETTALGVAMAAGAAIGVAIWSLEEDSLSKTTMEKWTPAISAKERDARYAKWRKAVERCMHWETSSGQDVVEGTDKTN